MTVLMALMMGVTMYSRADSIVEDVGRFGVFFHSRIGGRHGVQG